MPNRKGNGCGASFKWVEPMTSNFTPRRNNLKNGDWEDHETMMVEHRENGKTAVEIRKFLLDGGFKASLGQVKRKLLLLSPKYKIHKPPKNIAPKNTRALPANEIDSAENSSVSALSAHKIDLVPLETGGIAIDVVQRNITQEEADDAATNSFQCLDSATLGIETEGTMWASLFLPWMAGQFLFDDMFIPDELFPDADF